MLVFVYVSVFVCVCVGVVSLEETARRSGHQMGSSETCMAGKLCNPRNLLSQNKTNKHTNKQNETNSWSGDGMMNNTQNLA